METKLAYKNMFAWRTGNLASRHLCRGQRIS